MSAGLGRRPPGSGLPGHCAPLGEPESPPSVLRLLLRFGARVQNVRVALGYISAGVGAASDFLKEIGQQKSRALGLEMSPPQSRSQLRFETAGHNARMRWGMRKK